MDIQMFPRQTNSTEAGFGVVFGVDGSAWPAAARDSPAVIFVDL